MILAGPRQRASSSSPDFIYNDKHLYSIYPDCCAARFIAFIVIVVCVAIFHGSMDLCHSLPDLIPQSR